MLYPFSIILFYKVMWWFDGQNIGMEPKVQSNVATCYWISIDLD
jgi:hypothetical protein